jgi:hypothetical protein
VRSVAHYITVFYLTTLLLCLRYFYLVSCTEPGILPSKNPAIPQVDQKKAINERDYYAEYMNKNELEQQFQGMAVSKGVDRFYHLKKFKYLPQIFDPDINNGQGYVESKKKQNKLSYCNTCQFLRPPRSFHCSQCGVCIEVHDHHCPWVGTCIGYRNLSVFIAFLFWTAMHAIVTLTICCVAFDIAADQIEKDLVYSVVCKVLVAYTGMVTICLGSFCAY